MYKQDFIKTNDYLLVHTEGKRNFSLMTKGFNKIKEYCSKKYIDKVVIDQTKLTGHLDVMHHLHLGKSLAAHSRKPVLKMAIVKAKESAYTFTEKVAKYKGVNVKVFNKLEEADDWVKK